MRNLAQDSDIRNMLMKPGAYRTPYEKDLIDEFKECSKIYEDNQWDHLDGNQRASSERDIQFDDMERLTIKIAEGFRKRTPYELEQQKLHDQRHYF